MRVDAEKDGLGWWLDEQPSEEIKHRVEENLKELRWDVDVVLTHTAPLKYEPREVFLPGINQGMVDKSTEQWLDSIEERLDYSSRSLAACKPLLMVGAETLNPHESRGTL